MQPFVFDAFQVEADLRTILFTYALEGEQFNQKIVLSKQIPSEKRTPVFDQILLNLHIALGISYWKATCSQNIQFNSSQLSSQQAQFWNTVYTEGLGEFYYRNSIDFRNIVHFPFQSEYQSPQPVTLPTHGKELIGIGGGKDSILVWEQMKKKNSENRGLIIHTQRRHEVIDELARTMNIPHIAIDRYMDNTFINHDPQWKYNGHIPVSMIYAWMGILAAYVYDFDAFVVSNELSAEQANTTAYGLPVNHQWSKTKEFEALFTHYIHETISPNLGYYSPIRSMTELQIVQELVQAYPHYLPHIASCNRNFSITRPLRGKKWCGECPKCAFSFLMFAAYLPKKQVIGMFGKDMLADARLLSLFRDLGGRGGLKPFECVGTFEEVQEALTLIQKRGEFVVPTELLV